jgi:hypothetical protein
LKLVKLKEAQEAHVGVEQDVQREEAETVEHGCLLGSESGSRPQKAPKFRKSIPQSIPRRSTYGSQLVNGFACSSALPDGVAAGIAVASSTRVGAMHGRGL